MIVLITLGLAAGLFILDLKTPSGLGEWGLYLIPLLLTFRARQWWYPLVFSGVASVLLVAGYFGSPLAMEARWVAANRLVGLAVLWITAALLVARKRAEQARVQSEERFRAISEESLMGIYILQDEKFAYVNPKFAEIYGYAQTELLALPSALDLVTEEDQLLVRENVRRRLTGEVHMVRYHARVRHRDGSRMTVDVQGARTELNGKPAIIGTIQDITDHERGEAVLKRTGEQLQTLSRRLLELQETERRHIARELHDEIGQALTALKINLQAVQRLSGAASFAPRLVDSISIIDRTLRQVRDLSLDLRPSMLDDLGLCAALRWYADQQAQRAGLRIQFIAGELGARLDSAIETTCFRVAQEALTNIVRHARAANVRMQLQMETAELHLTVADDGVGFDLARLQQHTEGGASLGLLGMQERASLIGGRVEWKAAPQRGTEVHAWFPLAAVSSPTAEPEPTPPGDVALQRIPSPLNGERARVRGENEDNRPVETGS